jgi:hypothetical protein
MGNDKVSSGAELIIGGGLVARLFLAKSGI